MEYEISRGDESVTCLIKNVDDETKKDLEHSLNNMLETYEEDQKIFKHLRENPLPEPTELEKFQMQVNLYEKRLHHLKTFIDKVPQSREMVGSACFQVLVSVYGSKERAIQEWMRRSLIYEQNVVKQ